MNTNLHYPPDREDWPEGGEVFAALARRVSPSINFEQLRPVADLFFRTPYCPDTDWAPVPGQDFRSILTTEAVVASLFAQAWSDRAKWAGDNCNDTDAHRVCSDAVTVIRSSVRLMNPYEVEGGAL